MADDADTSGLQMDHDLLPEWHTLLIPESICPGQTIALSCCYGSDKEFMVATVALM
jgi:hypothetical protein